MLNLLRYFFYLGWNWRFSIAFHIIKHDIRGERKYGIRTTGYDELQHLEKSGIDTEHASVYMPASYDMLENLFEELQKYKVQHLLDLGCGKGRAMCVAAHYGIPRVTGIDLSYPLVQAAHENLRQTAKKIPFQFKVEVQDAFYYEIPSTVDALFLYNPFDQVVMSAVAENLRQSLLQHPRPFTIVYINPLHQSWFHPVGFKQVYYYIPKAYLEGVILHWKPKK